MLCVQFHCTGVKLIVPICPTMKIADFYLIRDYLIVNVLSEEFSVRNIEVWPSYN